LIFQLLLDQIDVTKFAEYHRRQPMVNVRRFLRKGNFSPGNTVILSVIASQDDYDKKQIKSVISLARRRDIFLSTIGLGNRAKKYEQFSKFDAGGVHVFISRTVKFLTTVTAMDEILSQICERTKKPSIGNIV